MLAISASIAVLGFFLSSAVPVTAAPPILPEPKEIRLKQVYYSYTLENTTSRPVSGVHFLAHAPVKQMAFQRCMSVMGSHPHALQTDALGNQVLRFEVDTIPPFARKVISVHAEIQQHHGAGWQMAIDPSMYLQTTRYVEAGHRKIVDAARALLSSDLHITAEKIFRFVSEHVRSDGYSSREFGAVYALERGRGDCTESTYLFVALCRAAGVPARGIGGYTIAGSAVLRPSRYHNWAEFHDGETWLIADPQQKVFAVAQDRYIATKVLHDFPEREAFPFHRFHLGDKRVQAMMNE